MFRRLARLAIGFLGAEHEKACAWRIGRQVILNQVSACRAGDKRAVGQAIENLIGNNANLFIRLDQWRDGLQQYVVKLFRLLSPSLVIAAVWPGYLRQIIGCQPGQFSERNLHDYLLETPGRDRPDDDLVFERRVLQKLCPFGHARLYFGQSQWTGDAGEARCGKPSTDPRLMFVLKGVEQRTSATGLGVLEGFSGAVRARGGEVNRDVVNALFPGEEAVSIALVRNPGARFLVKRDHAPQTVTRLRLLAAGDMTEKPLFRHQLKQPRIILFAVEISRLLDHRRSLTARPRQTVCLPQKEGRICGHFTSQSLGLRALTDLHAALDVFDGFFIFSEPGVSQAGVCQIARHDPW